MQVVYVSPLKALVYDIERNLRAPLAGIARAAEALELPIRVPTVAIRTGDTPQKERQRQLREPPSGPILDEPHGRERARASREKGIWSAIYPALIAEIRARQSTILFVNSRGLCERLCQRLNALAGEELVRAHHGSVSHEQRADIEEGLKAGTVRAIVATSSLEMGIDMGTVDQVLLVESPGSVASDLQRVGRAGHGVGEVSSGRCNRSRVPAVAGCSSRSSTVSRPLPHPRGSRSSPRTSRRTTIPWRRCVGCRESRTCPAPHIAASIGVLRCQEGLYMPARNSLFASQ